MSTRNIIGSTSTDEDGNFRGTEMHVRPKGNLLGGNLTKSQKKNRKMLKSPPRASDDSIIAVPDFLKTSNQSYPHGLT